VYVYVPEVHNGVPLHPKSNISVDMQESDAGMTVVGMLMVMVVIVIVLVVLVVLQRPGPGLLAPLTRTMVMGMVGMGTMMLSGGSGRVDCARYARKRHPMKPRRLLRKPFMPISPTSTSMRPLPNSRQGVRQTHSDSQPI
jgi:hypothetical protein